MLIMYICITYLFLEVSTMMCELPKRRGLYILIRVDPLQTYFTYTLSRIIKYKAKFNFNKSTINKLNNVIVGFH